MNEYLVVGLRAEAMAAPAGSGLKPDKSRDCRVACNRSSEDAELGSKEARRLKSWTESTARLPTGIAGKFCGVNPPTQRIETSEARRPDRASTQTP